ncbi:SOSS complex subunit B family protein [Halococcus salifodinae]|uniref:OB-fold tRNA/helicase-type nucleic acid binding-protein n=1 Tax=Halococcus salifodinae DSM 8989 TaxID=1227456 RepID=M0MVZ6_9EURY|nr:SOSS complex subunit B family protein [Halococcus salifodinae]EMA48600.1 OB-fold tRNA/helicase-type nucleic acid binding-protein [Halococcus salifodinae DSM 8989]
MSSKNFSDKTVAVAQSENESSDAGRVRDAERMRQYDEVQYPSGGERETELELSIDGVPGDEIGQKRAEQGRLDRGTDEAVNGSWGGPGGESEYDDKSLYTQERIEGREEELAEISKRAGANPEVHPRPEQKKQREQRTMETHQKRMEECREDVEAEAASGHVGRGFVDDPREHLDKKAVGEIYTQSGRVAERFGRSRATIAKRLSERVADGANISEAVMDLVEDLCEDRAVVSPLSMVEPTDSWATIEGVVATMFEPASSNQQQVAILEDESGEAKLTIWRNSNMDVRLNEGDVVRIIDAKPSVFNGQVTLAATSDTQIWRCERGDGPSPMGGIEMSEPSSCEAEVDEDDEFTPVPTNHREEWFFPQAADMPEVEGVDVDLSSFEGSEAQARITRVEAEDSDAVGFVAIRELQSDTYGVSWGEQVRKEFEKRGREQRVSEEKYNVPRWKKTVSRINHYEHTSISEFGANDRMVHLDLPELSNSE